MSVNPTFATRCLSISCALSLVIASAGFGAVFAWSQGSQHGPLLGCLSVLMAVSLEAAKPLAVSGTMSALASWKPGQALALALLAAVAVIFSLTAELQLMARSRVDSIATRADTATKAKGGQAPDARDSRDRARIELEKLGPTRPAIELAPLLKSARLLAKDCGKIQTATQREACKSLPALESELARAPRHAELNKQLEAAGTALITVTVQTTDPGSVALASYLSALGIAVDPARLGDWLVLIGVLSLEVGSAFGMVLVRASCGDGAGSNGQSVHRPISTTPEIPGPVALPLPCAPPVHDTAHLARQRVIDLLKANGGTVQDGQRGFAKRIGVSPTRIGQVLHCLAGEGVVKVRAGSTGTVVSLVAA